MKFLLTNEGVFPAGQKSKLQTQQSPFAARIYFMYNILAILFIHVNNTAIVFTICTQNTVSVGEKPQRAPFLRLSGVAAIARQLREHGDFPAAAFVAVRFS